MDGRNLDRRALTNAAMVKAENPIQQLQTDIDYLFESELFTIGEDKTSIVDSKNVSRRVKQCLTVMIDTNTSPGAKIKLADFICNKLHGIYNLKKSHSDIVVKHLVEAVLNGAAGDALADYNMIRTNRGLPLAGSVTLADIYLERRLELCFEGNLLWDLSRTERSLDRDNEDGKISGDIDISFPDYRWVLPIPTVEIQANDNMVQNPEY